MLTTAQETTLANALKASTDPTVIVALAIRNDIALTDWLNGNSAFICWRNSVQTAEVGKTVLYVAIANLTSLNQTRLQLFLLLNKDSFTPNEDIRTMFANVFSGALGGAGQGTRDGLEALWRRPATNLERVFATGTGTTLSPGTLGVEGRIDINVVSVALNRNP